MLHQLGTTVHLCENTTWRTDEDIYEEQVNTAFRTMLFIFGSLIAGALVKQLLKKYPLPYTVLIFCGGAAFGLFTKNLEMAQRFTGLTRVKPSIIMEMFLPILIFESAYSMDVHMLKRSLFQCLILAGPGLLLCTFLTAAYAKTALYFYEMNWTLAFIFGSILSATDPVAVVALLKESGISPSLTTLIEGESLLNDSTAIVMFDVLVEVMEEHTVNVKHITLTFLKIGLGAPIFGYVAGKITVLWLVLVYRDPVVEFTITLCSAYLTYYAAEELLEISGVLAVVVLALVINYRKSSFSPESEETVHSFWETLSYFANTLIFIIVGVIITERQTMTLFDAGLALSTYLCVSLIRMLMVLVFSPFLTRLGYGLPVRHGVVLIWGGLRGAVGLALALMLFELKSIMEQGVFIAKKILLQLSCIIVLTLLLNGVTMKYVLKLLKMDKIPDSSLMIMAHSVAHLREVASQSKNVHMRDKYLGGTDWQWVERATVINDPYKTPKDYDPACTYVPPTSYCHKCKTEFTPPAKPSEVAEMAEEARLRLLKALKKNFVGWLRRTLHIEPTEEKRLSVEAVCRETQGFHHFCLLLCMNDYFEPIICVILLLNMVPMIIQIFSLLQPSLALLISLYVVNFLFLVAYIAEAVVKLVGLGPRGYFKSHWNRFAFFIVIAGVVTYSLDISLLFVKWTKQSYIAIARVIRCVRLLEMGKHFRRLLSHLVSYVKNLVCQQIFEAFDLGHGYIHAQREVLEKIDFASDYAPCGQYVVEQSETGILEMVKVVAGLEEEHPGVAIAEITHEAAIRILNDAETALDELYEKGLVDEMEFEKIREVLEETIKEIVYADYYLPERHPPEDILYSVDWITDERLLEVIHDKNYTVLEYKAYDAIHVAGSKPKAISIVASGVVRVYGRVIAEKYELLPNTDTTLYFTRQDEFFDYVRPYHSLGLLGYLTNADYVTSAVCETDVQVICVSFATLHKAEQLMTEHPPLQYLLWRNIALKIAETLLLEKREYKGAKSQKLKLKLESAIVPDLSKIERFHVNPAIQEVVLIQGRVTDPVAGDLFIGPTCIPSSAKILHLIDDPEYRPRVVMVLLAPKTFRVTEDIDWSGIDSVPDHQHLCLFHAIKKQGATEPETEPTGEERRKKSVGERVRKRLRKRSEGTSSLLPGSEEP